MSSYVKVCYQKKDEPDVFGMQAYTYKTDMQLKVGDLVIAPTRHGDNVARVFEINVPESKVDVRWELKTIEKLYEPDKKEAPEEKRDNLCDSCKHEFAICSGKPQFAAGQGVDNVVTCDTYEREGADNE